MPDFKIVANGYAQETGFGPVFKYQIRIRSEEPTLIENSEVVDSFNVNEPMARMRTMIGRTSYMPYPQPNREVWWALDMWHFGFERWENISEGKSRLKKNAPPQ